MLPNVPSCVNQENLCCFQSMEIVNKKLKTRNRVLSVVCQLGLSSLFGCQFHTFKKKKKGIGNCRVNCVSYITSCEHFSFKKVTTKQNYSLG